MSARTRRFPIACTSLYCGSTRPSQCQGCEHHAALHDFKRWVKDNGAKPVCETYSPNIYVANEEQRNAK